jgi:hypothetical protein
MRSRPLEASQTQSPTFPPRVESIARKRPSGDHCGENQPELSSMPLVRLMALPPGARWIQTSPAALPQRYSHLWFFKVFLARLLVNAIARPSGEKA